jgi:phage terminase small subunit
VRLHVNRLVSPPLGRRIFVAKHPAVATAEGAAVQLAKLSGLLGLSPVAERHLGTITPRDDDGDCFTG